MCTNLIITEHDDASSSDSDYGRDGKRKKKIKITKPKEVQQDYSEFYFDGMFETRRSLRNLDRKQYSEEPTAPHSNEEDQDEEEDEKPKTSTIGT